MSTPLAAVLLELASEHFGDHCCNDFRLSDHVPDADDRRVIMRDYHMRNGDPETFDPTNDYSIVPDFMLMWLCAQQLRGAHDAWRDIVL